MNKKVSKLILEQAEDIALLAAMKQAEKSGTVKLENAPS